MCDTCGCNVTSANQHIVERDGSRVIDILQDLLRENNHQAAHNRHQFEQHQVLAINLMSAPGSGKTSLLETTVDALDDRYKVAVIEGDLETENDAQRIRDKGVSAVQITTGTACHLDAHMLHKALHKLDLANLDIVFIENVGNLVCPASFDLGHHRNVTLLSVTEGDDKPAKYPVMFRAADLVLLSKTDLLAVLDDFDPNQAQHYLRNLANPASIYPFSSKTGEGIENWVRWLESELHYYRAALERGEAIVPNIQAEAKQYHSYKQ